MTDASIMTRSLALDAPLAQARAAHGPLTVMMLISTHILGGPAKGLLQLIPELQRRGRVRPLLCTFARPGAAETPFQAACREQGVALHCFSQSFNWDMRAFKAVREFVRREGVDVIQTHGYKENICGLYLRRASGKPWLTFVHGTTDENLKVRLYHALDRFVAARADRIVPVSHELMRRRVPTALRHKVRVVENAIVPRPRTVGAEAVAQWRAQHTLTQPVVACVGRLSPEKGQDVLLRAAARLREMGVRFQLSLVGDGPWRAELEALAARLKLDAYVRFVGQQKDMDLVYAATDVLVLPSRKEGMPNVVLEGMLAGLPLVATQVGAVPDMLTAGENGVLVPVGDDAALARALRDVLCDAAFARRIGERARTSLFPRFSIAQRAQNVEAVYSELTGGELGVVAAP